MPSSSSPLIVSCERNGTNLVSISNLEMLLLLLKFNPEVEPELLHTAVLKGDSTLIKAIVELNPDSLSINQCNIFI